MVFKIFFDGRIFTVSSEMDECFKSVNGIGAKINKPEDVNELFDFFEQSPVLEFYVYTESPEDVFDCLKDNNRFIRAAGGVIFNNDNDVLLLRRLGYWDLPKGKMEENETEMSAACREIEEECGISGIEIAGKMIDTYHVYRDKDNMRVIKQTAWFGAVYSGVQPLKPQLEEGITEAVWMPLKDIPQYVPQMYASLADVMINVQTLLFVTSLENLQDVAKRIFECLGDKKIVALYGNMGAGKTTLIKAICREAGVNESVTSPTFSLVNEYKTSDNKTVCHFDFYRINRISEVYDLGYEEYFYSDKLCLIEWPEMIEELLPENTLRIYIKVLNNNKRIVSKLKS
jgi:tRNA threonylcarbamoyladenosine biosynthesis protein TsaE